MSSRDAPAARRRRPNARRRLGIAAGTLLTLAIASLAAVPAQGAADRALWARTQTLATARVAAGRAPSTSAPSSPTPASATPSPSDAHELAVPWSTPELAGAVYAQQLTLVGSDRALYFVAFKREAGQDDITGRLVLVDAAVRRVVWSVPSQGIGNDGDWSAIGHVVGDSVLVTTFKGVLTDIDLESGGVRSSAAPGVSLAGCSDVGGEDCPDLSGDVLVEDAVRGVTERVPATDLTTPEWTAKLRGAQIVGQTAVGEEGAVDVASGASVGWRGPKDVEYINADTHLIATRRDADQFTVLGIDSRSGAVTFTKSVPLSSRWSIDGDLLLYSSGDALHALDLGSGTERWATAIGVGRSFDVLPDSTALLVAADPDGRRQDAIDLQTGRVAFHFPPSAPPVSSAASDASAASDDDDGRLVYLCRAGVCAVDTSTGALLWTHPVAPRDSGDSPVEFIGDHAVQVMPSETVQFATVG